MKTRRLDAAQCPAQFLDLALVRQLLALGQFHQLEDLIELIHRVLQRFRDLRGMQHRLMDGRTFGRPKIRGLRPLLRRTLLWSLRFWTTRLFAILRMTTARLGPAAMFLAARRWLF